LKAVFGLKAAVESRLTVKPARAGAATQSAARAMVSAARREKR
jgi:hypothetical protein